MSFSEERVWKKIRKSVSGMRIISVEKLNSIALNEWQKFRNDVVEYIYSRGFIDVELLYKDRNTWNLKKVVLLKVLDRKITRKDVDIVEKKLMKILHRRIGFAFQIGKDWYECT